MRFFRIYAFFPHMQRSTYPHTLWRFFYMRFHADLRISIRINHNRVYAHMKNNCIASSNTVCDSSNESHTVLENESWLALGGIGSAWGDTGWYLEVLGHYVGIFGTWSVWGAIGWYLVELGQYGVVVAGNWWYWVSITRYCLVLSGIG